MFDQIHDDDKYILNAPRSNLMFYPKFQADVGRYGVSCH